MLDIENVASMKRIKGIKKIKKMTKIDDDLADKMREEVYFLTSTMASIASCLRLIPGAQNTGKKMIDTDKGISVLKEMGKVNCLMEGTPITMRA